MDIWGRHVPLVIAELVVGGNKGERICAPLPAKRGRGRYNIDFNMGDFKSPDVPTLCFASHRQPRTFEVWLAQWGAASAERDARGEGFCGAEMWEGRGPAFVERRC